MTERLSVIRHGEEGKSTYEVVVMAHRRQQQEQAAIARDIMTIMRSMKVGEVINIQIERVVDTDGPLRHWRCDGEEMPQGNSLAASAIEAAYGAALSNATPEPPTNVPWFGYVFVTFYATSIAALMCLVATLIKVHFVGFD
jgi:hypothetical protein